LHHRRGPHRRGRALRRTLYTAHQYTAASAERDAPLSRSAGRGASVSIGEGSGAAQGPGTTAGRRTAEARMARVARDRLQEIEAEQDGKHFILRTPVTGVAGKAFQAVGVALPPNIRDAAPA